HLILATNANVFVLLFLAFHSLESFRLRLPNSMLFLSHVGAIFLSIDFSTALTVYNLDLIFAGMERSGADRGYLATPLLD
ncbi:hypothetical protein TorRG33x02_346550, partial [Trema orientale]